MIRYSPEFKESVVRKMMPVCCKIEVGKVARQKSPDVQGGNPRECKGAIESLTGSPLPFWCYPGTEGEGMEDAHHDPGS